MLPLSAPPAAKQRSKNGWCSYLKDGVLGGQEQVPALAEGVSHARAGKRSYRLAHPFAPSVRPNQSIAQPIGVKNQAQTTAARKDRVGAGRPEARTPAGFKAATASDKRATEYAASSTRKEREREQRTRIPLLLSYGPPAVLRTPLRRRNYRAAGVRFPKSFEKFQPTSK